LHFRYATRARRITNVLSMSCSTEGAAVMALRKENSNLQSELAQLQQQVRTWGRGWGDGALLTERQIGYQTIGCVGTS
jgi:hypothetical protein